MFFQKQVLNLARVQLTAARRQFASSSVGEKRMGQCVSHLSPNGKGVCQNKEGGRTVFVHDALPGEVVDCVVTYNDKISENASVQTRHNDSAERVQAPCVYFGKCKGCQFQHVSMGMQNSLKFAGVQRRLASLGAKEESTQLVPSPDKLGYRNKLEFTIEWSKLTGKPTIGLVDEDDQVYAVQECILGQPSIQKMPHLLQTVMNEHEFGKIKRASVSGTPTGETMVVLTSEFNDMTVRHIAHKLLDRGVSSVYVNWVRVQDRASLPFRLEHIGGLEHLEYSLMGHVIHKYPFTFLQPNLPQAEQIYQTVLNYAQLTPQTTVLELYCGIGSLSLVMARKAKKVYALDSFRGSIETAKTLAQLNGVHNVDFQTQDAHYLRAHDVEAYIGYSPDVVVVDPPRTGLQDVIGELLRQAPHTLVYVSCNFVSLKKDLDKLAHLYSLETYAVFDHFPQTQHVEVVAKLVKK